LGSDNVVVIGGNAHVRTWESDRYSLSFSGWKSIGIFLICTVLPTDLETGEVWVRSHLIMGALHPAPIANCNRKSSVSTSIEKGWHYLVYTEIFGAK